MSKRLCRLTATIVAFTVATVLMILSVYAVSAIHNVWTAPDYWLAWFSGGTMLMGFIAGGIGFGNSIDLMDCNKE